jgi:hypothetical protein
MEQSKRTTGSPRYMSHINKYGYTIIQRCVSTRQLKNCEALTKRCVQGKQDNYANYLYENLSGMKEFWDIKASKKILNAVSEIHRCDSQVNPKFICFTNGIIFKEGKVLDLNPVKDIPQAVHAIISGQYGLSISILPNKTDKRKIINISPASAFIYTNNLDVLVEEFLNRDEKQNPLGKFYVPASYILYQHVPEHQLMLNLHNFIESVSTDFGGNVVPSDSTEKLPETVVINNFYQIATEKNVDNFFHLLGCNQKIVDELKALETEKNNLKHELNVVLKSNIQSTRNQHDVEIFPKKRKLLEQDLYLSDDGESSSENGADTERQTGLGNFGGKDMKIVAEIFNNDSQISAELTASTKTLEQSLQRHISCTNDWKKNIHGIIMVKSQANKSLQEENEAMKRQLEMAQESIFLLQQTNIESNLIKSELEEIIEKLKSDLKEKDTKFTNLKNTIQGLL